ncbi:uncharacterized protein LACBIDRAFT_299406 [Laccaria bicolor S238N-H82]|uniref:Predicted protein n=1 Tax=Laccaria bicolor (strain S238N-H82 / ATCC MYA-4686) TaxID=486041 RepID=B0DEM8_LACBS|nr:uncharacterized protein LACBIDRAFT_299406 [Laccaria bicolor S238N-H82]EDR06964.1 predicted protein [Laccaria bicolor S238N-H82]|eukprot:XP_001882337.1 predicted protein [Laccaria bicolor S238N-H82]
MHSLRICQISKSQTAILLEDLRIMPILPYTPFILHLVLLSASLPARAAVGASHMTKTLLWKKLSMVPGMGTRNNKIMR